VVGLLEPALESFSAIDEVCTARMLYGTAVARARDADDGIEVLRAVGALAARWRAHRAIEAEIAYYRGLAHWAKRQYLEASRYAAIAEAANLDILSVRAMELRAFIALASNKYHDALRLFERAREAYGRCRGRDLDLVTQLICQIAVLEMNLRSAGVPGSHADPGGRTIPGTAFGPAIATPHRMALASADAWLYALDGDRAMAVRKAHAAMSAAPSPAWRVRAFSSGATIFEALAERGNARYHADEAAKLAASVDWNATVGEERIALLMLAEVYAAVKPAAASGYSISTTASAPKWTRPGCFAR
jgi:tetratricopeptide (TPR) repeat protein